VWCGPSRRSMTLARNSPLPPRNGRQADTSPGLTNRAPLPHLNLTPDDLPPDQPPHPRFPRHSRPSSRSLPSQQQDSVAPNALNPGPITPIPWPVLEPSVPSPCCRLTSLALNPASPRPRTRPRRMACRMACRMARRMACRMACRMASRMGGSHGPARPTTRQGGRRWSTPHFRVFRSRRKMQLTYPLAQFRCILYLLLYAPKLAEGTASFHEQLQKWG
jgi:hypothetical protein